MNTPGRGRGPGTEHPVSLPSQMPGLWGAHPTSPPGGPSWAELPAAPRQRACQGASFIRCPPSPSFRFCASRGAALFVLPLFLLLCLCVGTSAVRPCPLSPSLPSVSVWVSLRATASPAPFDALGAGYTAVTKTKPPTLRRVCSSREEGSQPDDELTQ